MQNGPKRSQNGPKNDPKRFENDSKRAEKRLFYFFGRRNLPKHLPPSSQRVTSVGRNFQKSLFCCSKISGPMPDPFFYRETTQRQSRTGSEPEPDSIFAVIQILFLRSFVGWKNGGLQVFDNTLGLKDGKNISISGTLWGRQFCGLSNC